jgi:hypothetical protein
LLCFYQCSSEFSLYFGTKGYSTPCGNWLTINQLRAIRGGERDMNELNIIDAFPTPGGSINDVSFLARNQGRARNGLVAQDRTRNCAALYRAGHES